jgi:hypothetical protein
MGEIRFMDMLYAKYSCPMDLVSMYINRGRFGEFVDEFLTLEVERRKAEMEQQMHRDLWEMYVHSEYTGSFEDYKKLVTKPVSTTTGGTTRANSDTDLTEKGAEAIISTFFN